MKTSSEKGDPSTKRHLKVVLERLTCSFNINEESDYGDVNGPIVNKEERSSTVYFEN